MTAKQKDNRSEKAFHFTDREIRALPAHAGKGNETMYWDIGLSGLCLSVGKKRKTFYLRHTVKGKFTPGGYPLCRRIALGTFGDTPGDISLSEARTQAHDLIADMRKGIDPVAEREREDRARVDQERREREQAARAKQSQVTLRETLEGYLRDGIDLRESTRRGYRYAIERNLADYLDKPIASITSDDMLDVRRDIKTRAQAEVRQTIKKKADKQALMNESEEQALEFAGNGAISITFRTMKALFNYSMAKKNSAVLTNPLAPLQRQNRKLVKTPALRERTRYLEEHERAAFYQAIVALGTDHQDGAIARRGDPVLRDYYLVLLFTGFRRSEATGLQWHEIDFNNNTITLPESRTKNGKKLAIPMSDYLREVLHGRWTESGQPARGWVFPAHSKSGHIEEPRFYLDRACARAGITKTLTIHDLRRTFANVAEFEVGVPMSAAKALLNHSPGSNDVTLNNYINGVRNNPNRLRPDMQKVADKLKKDCGITGAQSNVIPFKQAQA
jgi:integrase